MTTPRHGYTELPTGQNASPESMNEAFEQLEQGANLFSVLDILNATPGSPTNGQMYLVGTSPTGQWSTDGAANKIATRRGGVWAYTTPKEGDYADVADEDALYRYSGSAWGTFTISGTVSTTGSPSSGKLAKFSGASTITNGDLTGDVTTSGGLATTLANSGVSAATYGDATHVPQVAVDAKGRITSASNIAITAYVPGGTDVAVADGGLGVSTVPTNGQIPIGNGTNYTIASLTAGANVTITPGAGSITIASSITGGTVGDGDYGDIVVTSSGTVYTIDSAVVTLSKIANASANSKLLGSGASGSGSSYSELTLGTGLSMSSTTLNVSGAPVLLEQHTASASATLDFTTAISSTYDEYLIEFVNVIPATNAGTLWMRMSTDGGSTYDSGTNYSHLAFGTNRFGGAATGAVDSGGTKIILTQSAVDNTSTAGISGSLRLFSPGSTSVHKNIVGTLNYLTGGTLETTQNTGWYRSTTAVNAFRFLFASGNITSGIIRVYGIPK